MAVGEQPLPAFYAVEGVRIATASAGIKQPGRRDLVIFELSEESRVSGLFTQNAFRAAPVQIAAKHLLEGRVRYFVVNTGNANAGTGEKGLADALNCCASLAAKTNCDSQSVLPFSTGVIGESLPVDKIQQAIPQCLNSLDSSSAAWSSAAKGILTTDTRAKGATRQVRIGEQWVHISGISKGAGMIKPNMATMLAFVATDASIEKVLLDQLLKESVEGSFNRITVDGDTSTNDACMLIATGKSKAPALLTSDEPVWLSFKSALNDLMRELAQAIVKDAEGATKFVSVVVEKAVSSSEALDVAYTVANSPLVKTALFACDPNWGRILAAVGRAELTQLDVTKMDIYLDSVCIVRNGGRSPHYKEEDGQSVMDRENITIRIILNRGQSSETVWTSDLSHEYVRINAEYRT